AGEPGLDAVPAPRPVAADDRAAVLGHPLASRVQAEAGAGPRRRTAEQRAGEAAAGDLGEAGAVVTDEQHHIRAAQPRGELHVPFAPETPDRYGGAVDEAKQDLLQGRAVDGRRGHLTTQAR